MGAPGSVWKWKALNEADRLDRALTDAITENIGEWSGEPRQVSRSQIQKLIEKGHVLANGAPARANSRISPGDRIEVRFSPPEPISLVPEERALDVLFEDQHLLVLNKPPGLTVHPSSTQKEGTLVHALLHHVKDLSGISGELRPGIVHRIDKNTSGALVITKTDQAHRKLVEVFSRHEIDRVYWALCYGTPTEKAGKIEGKIGRNPADRKKMAILESSGRHAVTHFSRIEEYAQRAQKPFASWLELKLETGRTHQIRVHLTSIGHSILGDPVYGAPSSNQPKWKALPDYVKIAISALPGQALHARVLGFKHPISGEALRFEAAPPEGFSKLLSSLQRYR